MSLETWLGFFVASWIISISPGAGAVACMSAGLNHGFRRGYFMTIGLVLGIVTQVFVVAVGLGAIIASSSTLFAIIKWGGVAYLIWLGVSQLRAKATPIEASSEHAQMSRKELVARGWVINSLNPKGTVFLLAVMPQFLDLKAPLVPQYLTVAATIAFTDLVVMAGYTALASNILAALKSPAQIRWMNRTFGSLFIGAALLLASFKRA
jgi:homoserine/homoserine lactone efflux protein